MSSTTSIKAYDAMLQLAFARMQPEDLPEVRRIEEEVYPFPWTAGNFADSLANGYRTRVARDATGTIVGYFLILLAVDEAHLLNITVRRNLQARGIGRMMLGEAAKIAREEGMRSMLLEVRPSNLRALAIYERFGFRRIGVRRGYYPNFNQTREDAIVMRMDV